MYFTPKQQLLGLFTQEQGPFPGTLILGEEYQYCVSVQDFEPCVVEGDQHLMQRENKYFLPPDQLLGAWQTPRDSSPGQTMVMLCLCARF